MENQSVKPTLGRIVIYKTTAQERAEMQFPETATHNNVQNELPAVVVAIFEHTSYQNNECNIKVFLDGGSPDLWKTSVPEGDAEGTWHWPVRMQSKEPEMFVTGTALGK